MFSVSQSLKVLERRNYVRVTDKLRQVVQTLAQKCRQQMLHHDIWELPIPAMGTWKEFHDVDFDGQTIIYKDTPYCLSLIEYSGCHGMQLNAFKRSDLTEMNSHNHDYACREAVICFALNFQKIVEALNVAMLEKEKTAETALAAVEPTGTKAERYTPADPATAYTGE